MDLGSLLLIFALFVVVALFISRPLLEQQTAPAADAERQEEHELSYLLAERDRVLNALQELDFDYDLQKIPEEDYGVQRAALLKQGAEVLRRLDAHQAQAQPVSAEERLEIAIAERRAAASASVAPNGRRQALATASPDDDIEALLADRRRVRQEKAAGFWPHCGGPVQKSDRFCPKCGAKNL
jgi:hypothetical protein